MKGSEWKPVDKKLKEEKVIIECHGLGDVNDERCNKTFSNWWPLSFRDGVTLSIQYYKWQGTEVMETIHEEFSC